MVVLDFPVGNAVTYLDPRNKSSDMGFFGYHYEGMFRTKEQLDAFMAENPNYTIFKKKPELGMLYYADVKGPKDASGQYTKPDGNISEKEPSFHLLKKADNHYNVGFQLGCYL